MKNDRNLQRPGFAQQGLQLRAWRIHAQPQFSRMKIRQHRRHASHVISVSVRHRHHIELMKPSRPEVRRHDIFANIQFRMHPERYTAGIHQESVSLRRHQQDRIALTDVDCSEFQYAGLDLRVWRNNAYPECAQDQRSPSGYDQQPTLAAAQHHRQNERPAPDKMTVSCGVGTRVSAIRKAPNQRTEPFIACKAIAAIMAGIFANASVR